MSGDLPYLRKAEDGPTDSEPPDRTEAPRRRHLPPYKEPPGPPARKSRGPGMGIVWILVTVVLLGGLSAITITLGTAAMDDDAVSMDAGQIVQGIGIGGIVLTLLVVVIIMLVYFD